MPRLGVGSLVGSLGLGQACGTVLGRLLGHPQDLVERWSLHPDSNSLLYTQLQFLCIWAFFVYRAFLVVEFVYDKTHVPRICVHVPSICVQKSKFCVNMHFFGRFFCKVVCGYTSPLYVHRWSMYVYTQDRRALYAKGVRCVHTHERCVYTWSIRVLTNHPQVVYTKR